DISSIDTAFLNNQPDTKIPIEIESQLKDDYVVVVPNQLYKWHPNYRNIKEDILDSLFLKVIGYFTKKKLKVVLLPQLFGLQNDSEYFNHLKNQSEKQDFIIIVDDNYSSDIQQKIIRQAKFLVGARYHTIIFSVNNRRPFLSLAYEHKMTNTLELIDLSENNIYIKKILNNELDIKEILEKKYNDGQNSIEEINKSSDIAQNISKDTLKYLVDNFLMSENKSKI
ncbi:MAG: polysaccharide pyruvyl transferase family protein, partial [Candidatus Lokiarchaeota archaeon]|nr:polysaccharide pyruvyl transferase family protein [Candidatus Lokiarchaeota archaeon]